MVDPCMSIGSSGDSLHPVGERASLTCVSWLTKTLRHRITLCKTIDHPWGNQACT